MKCESKDENPYRHNNYYSWLLWSVDFGKVEVTELTAFKTISMRIRGRLVPIYNENYSLCYAV